MSAGKAFLAGLLAGSRTLAPPAALAFAARSGRLPVQGTRLGALAKPAVTVALAALAAGEVFGDKLPGIGSRTNPLQFGARIASGALCGALIGLPGNVRTGLDAGAAGAVVGTLIAAGARSALAKRLGGNLPAGLIEDVATLASATLLLA